MRQPAFHTFLSVRTIENKLGTRKPESRRLDSHWLYSTPISSSSEAQVCVRMRRELRLIVLRKEHPWPRARTGRAT
jgi:hypothetical protein